MGGVDNSERPPKRTKLNKSPSWESSLSLTEPNRGSVGDAMARPLPSQNAEATVGSKGVIRRDEFVRIITNALYSLGYNKSAKLLEEESGIPLYSSLVEQFRKQILGGQWDESIVTLKQIILTDEKIFKNASFLILECKFLELLKNNRKMDALTTLRTEIAPIDVNNKRVHELSRCLIAPDQCKMLSSRDGDNVSQHAKLLEELQQLLPSTIMIPGKRLEHLVEQALYVQREACIFHNSVDFMSLYSDHQCGRDELPSHTLQVLAEHSEEVWFLQFSHNGKYLASSSKDKSAIIWEVNEDETFVRKHILGGHSSHVLSLAWSPDDRHILTCEAVGTVCCWNVTSGECLRPYRKPGIDAVNCCWLPDGNRLLTGLVDKSICMWALVGEEIEWWKGQLTVKTSDLAVTSDGQHVISVCRENAIMLLDLGSRIERVIEENQAITSFSISEDDKFLLVNLLSEEIHLWCIIGEPNVVSKYKGHRLRRFIIRSCFGGLEQAFIASGSEDSQVYIWHRGTGELVGVLPGHSGSVNAVSWNPRNPHMLASASDDKTIRIWGLNRPHLKRKGTRNNGVAKLTNGNS